jgi:hypothetical protein
MVFGQPPLVAGDPPNEIRRQPDWIGGALKRRCSLDISASIWLSLVIKAAVEFASGCRRRYFQFMKIRYVRIGSV